MKTFLRALAFSLMLSLTACPGGGGGSASAPKIPAGVSDGSVEPPIVGVKNGVVTRIPVPGLNTGGTAHGPAATFHGGTY